MTGPIDGGADEVRVPDRRMIDLRVAPPVGRLPRPAPPPGLVPSGFAPPVPPAPPGADGPDRSADAGVRPFVMTDGRTEPADRRLRVETQVLAAPRAAGFLLSFERRQIVDLCRGPMSVAEIAAALGLPLAVARVLVADLVTIGAVDVQEPSAVPSRALLERVLERVHAL